MSKTERAQSFFANLFMPGNGWRAFGAFMALALAYNGWTVGTEYQGVPLSPFLASSLELLAWSNVLWAALFIAVGLVALLCELLHMEAHLRCVMYGAVFVLFCAAALAVVFSPYPPVVAGRYMLGAYGALQVALAAARADTVERELEKRLQDVFATVPTAKTSDNQSSETAEVR